MNKPETAHEKDLTSILKRFIALDRLLMQGLTLTELATHLGTSTKTVGRYIKVLAALGQRSEAVRMAGFVDETYEESAEIDGRNRSRVYQRNITYLFAANWGREERDAAAAATQKRREARMQAVREQSRVLRMTRGASTKRRRK